MTTEVPAAIFDAATQHIAEIEDRLERSERCLARAQEHLQKAEVEVDRYSQEVGAETVLLASVKGYYKAQGLILPEAQEQQP